MTITPLEASLAAAIIGLLSAGGVLIVDSFRSVPPGRCKEMQKQCNDLRDANRGMLCLKIDSLKDQIRKNEERLERIEQLLAALVGGRRKDDEADTGQRRD